MWNVTYDIVTPESAKDGDFAECGFVNADGSHTELPPGVCGTPAGKIKTECGISFREAFELIGANSCDRGGGPSWYSINSATDYATGAETRYAIHAPDNITGSSLARVARLLEWRSR